jgi:putative transposase
MMVSEKIRLFPTPDQETKFKQFAGAARFVYNYALGLKIEYYREYNESLTTQNLIDFVKSLKYETERYAWLLDVPEAVTKQAIKDLDTAYKNFFKRGNIGFPKFKKKGKCTESFYQRTDNFRQVDSEHIKLTGIKEFVRIRPNNIVFPANNPRVSFDGKYWYLSYSFEVEEHKPNLGGATVGVDLGIKKLAVRSDGVEVKNINNSPRVKTLEKRLKHLQRQVSRKHEQNKNKGGRLQMG